MFCVLLLLCERDRRLSLLWMQFYLDNLEDELSVTALRMLVKDLLILFQAGNEGVINVLGVYYSPLMAVCGPWRPTVYFGCT